MLFLSPAERSLLHAVSQLAFTNPFLPERMDYERQALGSEFVEGEAVWSLPVDRPEETRRNIRLVVKRLEPLAAQLQARLAAGVKATAQDLALYEDSILHLLYQQYQARIFDADFKSGRAPNRWRFYQDYLADWSRIFVPGVAFPTGYEPAHTFACFRQIRRAFETIFSNIIGSSLPAARLRASVWQSIFSHDMRRYRRTLYERMGDFATLITGPSGTGKELAARAIAESRYVPFDAKKMVFADEDDVAFFPINISALSPTLVESELFGHRRGSFTGATGDRKGWLQTCPGLGSVFLDELGDLDPTIQVKLLRVIETRTFHPVGDTASLEFRGKLIAATNRDLAADIQEGRFREDLYYRLCSDQITTPSLAEQIASAPHVLWEVVAFLARKVAGAEAEDLSREVMEWIAANLPSDYPWPGNYRELEQCLKNVLIRRNYRPSRPAVEDASTRFERDFRAGRLTAEQVLSRYCAIVYRQTGSYEETARRVGLDRRTVKSKVLLGSISEPGPSGTPRA